MKSVELDKSYNPNDFENRIYEQWKEHNVFGPAKENNESYTIVMPPPNVTGILHMGHALNNVLQDILARYARMNQKDTLWLPGTDHAGIATQHVVERELKKKGKTRQELGREKFLEETWKVKEYHHGIITRQLEKIGSSCDWNRERFTMDEGLSKAVREAFVSLYEKNLIYKGNYLVNYCTHCGTALADDEVEYKPVTGALYQVTYPYEDQKGAITVATTRPETMFGDAAVAVNPDDDRYKDLVGKNVILPLADKPIPIIADSYVDMEFGTGMVKITPAHDPNDWAIGQRHDLPVINILNADGTLNENVPEKYRGLDVETARSLVVKDLSDQEYLIDQKPHNHEVGHCYRCSTVIEPFVSEQWFVSMKSMADKALKAWEDGEIHFYAKRWENTYSHWLRNIRDWCISRQLWWGHRIPVWYCDDCGHMMVEREDPSECSACHSKHIRQEEDVLDTWFSSWLWPFSTLGWPEKSVDMERFFPTNTLVTGYDIIFFWVSRMIMASLEFVGSVPFKDIYITGLVRDKTGRKMSKSLGNGIDPLDVVAQYGADSMKFTLCYLAAQGQDILIDFDSFKLGSRFANKVWNATRFLLMNLEGRNLVDLGDQKISTIDGWMYHKVNTAAKGVEEALATYKFNEASQIIYDVFWNDFCDWYVEATKFDLKNKSESEKDVTVSFMLDILSTLMRLMHPFLSFITEEIYQKLPNTEGMIITSEYPRYDENRVYEKEHRIVSNMQEFVKSIRAVRSELQIGPERKLSVIYRPDGDSPAISFIESQKELISSFINASSLTVDTEKSCSIEGTVPVAGPGFEAFVFVKDAIDVESEIRRVELEIAKSEQLLKKSEMKLNNEKFIQNAKEEAIEKEKAKHEEFTEKIEKGKKHLDLLKLL
ncbi:MAG: valine--tRNA ligase [Sphaerochaetaceae bacterium]|nr:valine--tRNA ligase [Sphaerochaetaceae bacterium]